MAKSKPYAVFQTEEEFNKAMDKMYDTGYSRGHHDGRINALSYFLDVASAEFEVEEHDLALKEANDRNIGKWKREEEFRKLMIEEAKQTASKREES